LVPKYYPADDQAMAILRRIGHGDDDDDSDDDNDHGDNDDDDSGDGDDVDGTNDDDDHQQNSKGCDPEKRSDTYPNYVELG
ncbi:hypothetical protein BSL78_16591, partial [Apostichopus japonicus]